MLHQAAGFQSLVGEAVPETQAPSAQEASAQTESSPGHGAEGVKENQVP